MGIDQKLGDRDLTGNKFGQFFRKLAKERKK